MVAARRPRIKEQPWESRDALTSHRCYRAATPIEESLDSIRSERGEHLDPGAHDAVFEVLDEILKVKQRYEDEAPD